MKFSVDNQVLLRMVGQEQFFNLKFDCAPISSSPLPSLLPSQSLSLIFVAVVFLSSIAITTVTTRVATSWISGVKRVFSKLGPPRKFLEQLLSRLAGDTGSLEGEWPEIPQAKGSFSAVGGQAFFIPLYGLFLTHGGIFRLTVGPKSFLFVSDPAIAKHILRDNSEAYSKGILAEILEFVMGKCLISADYEIWRVQRRAIVPALHQKAKTPLLIC